MEDYGNLREDPGRLRESTRSGRKTDQDRTEDYVNLQEEDGRPQEDARARSGSSGRLREEDGRQDGRLRESTERGRKTTGNHAQTPSARARADRARAHEGKTTRRGREPGRKTIIVNLRIREKDGKGRKTGENHAQTPSARERARAPRARERARRPREHYEKKTGDWTQDKNRETTGTGRKTTGNHAQTPSASARSGWRASARGVRRPKEDYEKRTGDDGTLDARLRKSTKRGRKTTGNHAQTPSARERARADRARAHEGKITRRGRETGRKTT